MAKREIPNALQDVSKKSRDIVTNALNGARAEVSPNTPAAPTPLAPRKYGYVPSDNTSGQIEIPLAFVNGLTGIATSASQLSDIGDTSYYQNQINRMGNIGRYEVNSYDQLYNQYDMLDSYQPNLDYDTIRGGSTSERVGNLLSGTLSGATSGFQVGGIAGGIVGGLLGAGAGVGSWLSGDRKAEDELKRLRLDRYIASDTALQNLQARAESLADYNFRNQVPRIRKEGGQIERKQTTLKDFADSISKKQKTNDTTHSAGIVREYCNGGVKIRIKR